MSPSLASKSNRAIQASETFRDHMRGATHDEHQRLHEVPAFLALRQGDLSRTDFTGLLKTLLGLHAPFETGLAAHDGLDQFGWRAIGASPNRPCRLMGDLTALGVDELDLGSIPMADLRSLALTDPDVALGAAWVIEGSSIGGGVIAKWLSCSLGIGPANGGAFFGQTADHIDRWRGCCESIEARGANALARRQMLAGANGAFSLTSAWFGMEA